VTSPADFQIISPRLALWHRFDPSVKADLFSTAILTNSGSYLIDPTPIDQPSLTALTRTEPVTGIIVTNQNHWRSSAALADVLSVPIFANDAAQLPDSSSKFTTVTTGDQIGDELEVIVIEGGAPGELAIFDQVNGGTMVVGDALINFEPYGFTFLPAKYCVNHRKMKKSLLQLGERRFECLFFAHGMPILSRASERLAALCNEK
jgi:Metallo-beta-lactamase superfamily